MDGALEHSDSDSGESWTLLDNIPSSGDEAPETPEPSPKFGDSSDNIDNEEETDGISIISDGDGPDLVYDKIVLEEYRPTEHQIPEYISIQPTPNNNNDTCESIRADDDFLGDNARLKTYVHRRNKRLSTVLNIIVLGSVITAAGVAIGHMWGVRHDCSMNTTPSVNKILSNLYKLQEENAYLRNKLKELTLMSNVQLQQRKRDSEEQPRRLHKCRKVFEEPLDSKNVNKFSKCVDHVNPPEKYMVVDDSYEKELLSDLNKLKHVYQQNKTWLDKEIAKRMKHEEKSSRKYKNDLKSSKFLRVNVYDSKAKPGEFLTNTETVLNVTDPILPVLTSVPEIVEPPTEKKVTYADSLKSDHKIRKREIIENKNNKAKERSYKKKPPKEIDTISENSSESELTKDDRYNAHKLKLDRKKNDRHKSYIKQKRRNKYEQWEMKGGYMKDYDDFSVTSSQENEFILKNTDKNHLSRDFERKNYIDQFSESEDNMKNDVEVVERKSKKVDRLGKRNKPNGNKDKDPNWYEKRAALRQEARKKLESALFGESTPNNAGWYFRRMQRREQCRVKGDNTTYKKNSKRMKNFKTKH